MNRQSEKIKLTRDLKNNNAIIGREYLPAGKEELQSVNFQILQVKNVSFSYPDSKPLFKDLSFELFRGEIIALLGKSGSGKSTSLAILQKLYTIQSGSITINGQSLKHVCTSSWRNIIGIVPQEIAILTGTLLDNIGYGAAHSSVISIIDFCKSSGFNQFFECLPDGYFTKIGKGGSRLSAGQKQLIALARALYRRPQLLLLDEVTSAMDPIAEKFTMELLTRFKWSISTVLITKKTEAIKLADRIYVIRSGKIKMPSPYIQ